MKKYKVLGIKGNKVEINEVEYDAQVDIIELTDEEAEQPLKESKIALISDESGTTTTPPAEENKEEAEDEEEDEDGEDDGSSEGEKEESEDEEKK